MKIRVSSHLYEYTEGREFIEAEGATARALFEDVDARRPGFYFRIVDEQGNLRPHINVFLDTKLVRDLDAPLDGVQTVHVLGALSGG